MPGAWAFFKHVAHFLVISPVSRQICPASADIAHSRDRACVSNKFLQWHCRQRTAERHFCPAQQAGKPSAWRAFSASTVVLRRASAMAKNPATPFLVPIYTKNHETFLCLIVLSYYGIMPSSKWGRRGKVAVGGSNQRWCSDGFEFNCDNVEKLRVIALDCCDREALHWARWI